MNRLVALVAALATGCSLVTRFDLSKVSENSNALCADGIDNDANGLTDCQDFGCLGQPTCCKMPVVVLSDDFSRRDCAQAPCDAPAANCALDANKWQIWGLPDPALCGGGLSPNKQQLCYEVGVLGQVPLPLHPGLSVSVDVAGIPETAGHLVVGLTLQESVGGGDTACAPIEGLNPVVAAESARTPDGGYVVLAQFDGNGIGASPEISDDAAHLVKLAVGADRRVTWSLDDGVFAVSPADEPLPTAAPTVRLGLAGRGLRSRFLDVRVSDGTQCDAPAAWTAATPFVALDATHDQMGGWDAYQVYQPAALRFGDTTLLYYTGCTASPLGGACSLQKGIGLATAADALNFARADFNPVEDVIVRNALDGGMLHSEVAQPTITAYFSNDTLASVNDRSVFSVRTTGATKFPGEPSVPSLRPGPAGSWDDAEVCCATAVTLDARNVLLWFAGHAKTDATWRIGLARSSDGGMTFVEDTHNPIVREGALDAFDGKGATDPEVLWDATRNFYRMWYTGQAFLGRTSIGYAVSTDGATWHKYPGNPVLSPGDVGLEEVGSPALIADDAGLRLWLQGREPSATNLRIYQLVNGGAPPGR